MNNVRQNVYNSDKVYIRDIEMKKNDFEDYQVPLSTLFKSAQKEYPSISINKKIMGGAPCIAGTRIPVYIILQMIAYKGSLDDALKAYEGRLTLQEIIDAIHFASSVLECSPE